MQKTFNLYDDPSNDYDYLSDPYGLFQDEELTDLEEFDLEEFEKDYEDQKEKYELNFNVPDVLSSFLDDMRYKIAYGGRGSGKTRTISSILIAKAISENHLILCVREIQNSINDSVKSVLEREIYRQGLEDEFTITNNSIIHEETGSKFIFKGLSRNIESIKSIEGVTIVWVEEAEVVSKKSLDVLIPTIRDDGSEIFISFNPRFETDPVYKMFVDGPVDESRTTVVNINYFDNPWFPEVLKKEMEWLKQHDYDLYLHVYEGQLLKYSDDQVFKGRFSVAETPEPPKDTTLYFGADFGFHPDPATLVRCWIDHEKNILYVDYEAYGTGIDYDDYKQFYESVPGSKDYLIVGDSSRPDTINYLKKWFRIDGSIKGTGSIEDGISFIKKFDQIIINPRCVKTIFEFNNYKYKRDKQTDEILPIIIDKHSHCIDAIRYAIERVRKGTGFFNLDL